MATDGERIARIEQAVSDLRDDVREIREAAAKDHHRLRSTESAVNLLLEAQKQARREEARQYRRMADAVQFGGLVMSIALVALAVVTLITHAG